MQRLNLWTRTSQKKFELLNLRLHKLKADVKEMDSSLSQISHAKINTVLSARVKRMHTTQQPPQQESKSKLTTNQDVKRQESEIININEVASEGHRSGDSRKLAGSAS